MIVEYYSRNPSLCVDDKSSVRIVDSIDNKEPLVEAPSIPYSRVADTIDFLAECENENEDEESEGEEETQLVRHSSKRSLPTLT